MIRYIGTMARPCISQTMAECIRRLKRRKAQGNLRSHTSRPWMEELQAGKRREVAAECERLIYAGINVTLADGSVEHYALTIEDQLNLFGKQIQVSAGQAQIEYHADGQPCRYYSPADMQTIIQAAMWHVSYHTTYCNALNMWIAGCQTAEEVQEIFYGADVPEEYQSEVLKTYLTQIAGQMGVSTDGAQTER